MREIRLLRSMSGVWKRSYGDPLRHRQTKGAATDMVDLTPPRHIPTLPKPAKPEPNRRPKTGLYLGRAGNFG